MWSKEFTTIFILLQIHYIYIRPHTYLTYLFIGTTYPANNFLGSNLPEVFGGEHRLPNIRAPKKSRVTSAFFGLPSASIYPDNEEQPKIAVFGLRRVIRRKYFGSSSDETHQKTCPGSALCLISFSWTRFFFASGPYCATGNINGPNFKTGIY